MSCNAATKDQRQPHMTAMIAGQARNYLEPQQPLSNHHLSFLQTIV